MAISRAVMKDRPPYYGIDANGLTATIWMRITGIVWGPDDDTMDDILGALPHYGQSMGEALDSEWVPSSHENTVVTGVSPEQPAEAGTDVWYAQITFGPPSGTIHPDRQYVRWSGGTITRRVEVDLYGYAIGLRNWVQATDGKPLHPNTMKRRRMQQASLTNEHAELGADVHMPAMEFEIQVPLASSQWDQAFMETTTIARGRVNNIAFTFVDEWNMPFYIAPYWSLLLDVLVEPEPRAANGHRISYRFMLAALDLPASLPRFWNRGPLGDYSGDGDADIPDPLPVGYGAFVAFKPMNADGVYAPDTGEVPQPRDIRVFQAHLGYDFNDLPGIIR